MADEEERLRRAIARGAGLPEAERLLALLDAKEPPDPRIAVAEKAIYDMYMDWANENQAEDFEDCDLYTADEFQAVAGALGFYGVEVDDEWIERALDEAYQAKGEGEPKDKSVRIMIAALDAWADRQANASADDSP